MSYLLPLCWAGDGARPNHYVLIPGYPVVFNLFRHSLPMAGVQILSIQLRPKWGALSFFPVWAVGARPFECLLGALRPKMDGIRLISICLLPDWGWLEACLNGVPYSVDPISCLDDLYDAPSVRIPAYEPHRIAVEAIPPDANDGFFERFVQQHVLSVEEIVSGSYPRFFMQYGMYRYRARACSSISSSLQRRSRKRSRIGM